MKILSRVKDYYDYLQGIYGVDELLVLDRTNFYIDSYPTPKDFDTYRFYIAGKVIEIMYYQGKMLFGKDLEGFSIEENKYWHRFTSAYSIEDYYYIPTKTKIYDGFYILRHSIEDKKKVNELLNCPVVIDQGWRHFDKNKCIINPILANYQFASIIPAEEIWLMLSDWLSQQRSKKEVQKELTDKEKIVSRGFDLKESFRGKPPNKL